MIIDISQFEMLNKHIELLQEIVEKQCNNPLSKQWLTSKELRETMSIDTKTLKKWKSEGLKVSKINAKEYYNSSDVDAFLRSNYEY